MENIFGGITMEEQAKEYKIQGSSMMALQNYEKAKEYFEKAAEIENSAELQIDIGNAAASMELYDDAVNAFSQALLLEPDNGEAMFDIGSVYLLQSKFKRHWNTIIVQRKMDLKNDFIYEFCSHL